MTPLECEPDPGVVGFAGRPPADRLESARQALLKPRRERTTRYTRSLLSYNRLAR